MRFDRDQVREAADIAAIIGQCGVKLRPEGKELLGLCPFHKETTPSFTVSNGLFKCFGCDAGGDVFEFIKRAEGLNTFPEQLRRVAELAGVLPIQNGTVNDTVARTKPQLVAAYPYTDEKGELLYEVRRFEPGRDGKRKDFSQRRPDGRGGYIDGLGNVRRVFYRLQRVIAADTVCYVEGEEDVHALEKLGLVATTKSGGVHGQLPEGAVDLFRGKTVYIFPDRDEPGEKYAQSVARLLAPVATVFFVRVPPPHKDIRDYVKAGHTDLSQLESEPFRPTMPPERITPTSVDAVAPAAKDEWPKPLDEVAHYGIAGEIVRLIEPHTEADAAAVLVQFLAAFGSAAGRDSYYRAGSDMHFPNLFAVLVGRSSKGRKGSSWSAVFDILKTASPVWADERVQSGLSSGEGLVWHVRDPIETKEPVRDRKTKEVSGYQSVVTDQGVADKRLLVIESEFASVLKVAAREGSTLSATVRQALDSGSLRIMTKTSPCKSTGAHISIIGHVTRDELLKYLTSSESGNGFGNRFLWVCARRSKLLPDGGEMYKVDFGPVLRRLSAALEFARRPREMRRDEEAGELWREVYPVLSGERYGLFGAVTSRAEAQTLRLSTIYALLDSSPVIRLCHLVAALEVWRYCEDSARFVFGETLGDKTADILLQALRGNPAGFTREQIMVDVFGRHKRGDEITRALNVLKQLGLAVPATEATAGRTRERWVATDHTSPSSHNSHTSHSSLTSQPV